jgi:hypothetical protein
LNGVKHLNYLAFKEALLIYLDSSIDKSDTLKKITHIKSRLKADLETDAPEMPKEHSVRITPYWLVGFAEGDGSFCISRRAHYGIQFILTAYNKQKSLFLAVKNYLDNLNLEQSGINFSSLLPEDLRKIKDLISSRSFIFEEKEGRGENTLPKIKFATSQVDYLMNHLVPELLGCRFFTKKAQDFYDFVLAGIIIQSGKHTTKLGIKTLNILKNGMNTGRDYSYKSEKSTVANSLIKEVLDMDPIYCYNQDGLRVNVKSLALVPGQIFYIACSTTLVSPDRQNESLIFTNTEECGRFFGVTKQTINVKLASGNYLSYKGKEYFFNRKGF